MVTGTVSMATKKETRRPVKSKDCEKKLLEACKLEEQVTKEGGLPLWLRVKLEEGKVETLKDYDGPSVAVENDTAHEPETLAKGGEQVVSADRGENDKMDRKKKAAQR